METNTIDRLLGAVLGLLFFTVAVASSAGTEVMEFHVGDDVILPCKPDRSDSLKAFAWSFNHANETKRQTIISWLESGEVQRFGQWSGRVDMNTTNGLLNVSQAVVQDQGTYTCLFEHFKTDSPAMEGFSHIVAVTENASFEMSGLDDDLYVLGDGRVYDLQCSLAIVHAVYDLYWLIGGRLYEPPVEVTEDHGDGRYTIQIRLSNFTFSKSDGKVHVGCLATDEGDFSVVRYNRTYKEIDVFYKPEGQSDIRISTEGQRTVLNAYDHHNFTCSHTGDSNPPPNHFTFYRDGTKLVNSTLRTYHIPKLYFKVIVTDVAFSCVASSIFGVAERSEEMLISIEAGAHIEAKSPAQQLDYDSPDFELFCVGSGHNVTVKWMKDDSPISDVYFKDEGSGYFTGLYDLNQTVAFKRRYVYKPLGINFACSDIEAIDGHYWCVVESTSSAGVHTVAREKYSIFPRYPPVSRFGKNYHEVSGKLGENGVIPAPVCARPSLMEDTNPTSAWHNGWKRQDERWVNNRYALHGEELVITNVVQEDFGIYIRRTQNPLGYRMLIVNFVPFKTPAVKLVKESFKYNYDTTHMYFVWGILDGIVDKVELQYRERQSQSNRSRNWTMMATINPSGWFYDDVTGVQLDPASNYKLQLVAYDGVDASLPTNDAMIELAPSTDLASTSKVDRLIEMTGILREEITLTCDAYSHRNTTQYRWSKPNGMIADESGASLTIANVTEEDYGYYICSATNTSDVIIHLLPFKTPVVRLVRESFQYDYVTTHLYFLWVILAGHPDRLDLLYRDVQSTNGSRPGWAIMVTMNPSDLYFDDVTGIQLDPSISYEFQLVAYDGSHASPPTESSKMSLAAPAFHTGKAEGFLSSDMDTGVSIALLVLGFLAGLTFSAICALWITRRRSYISVIELAKRVVREAMPPLGIRPHVFRFVRKKREREINSRW